jgi:Peptidase A4 family
MTGSTSMAHVWDAPADAPMTSPATGDDALGRGRGGSHLGTWLLPSSGALASLLVVAPAASAATIPPSCAGLDAYRAAPSERANCGIKTFPRRGVSTLSDGGKRYEFVVDELDVTYNVPPANFDPLTASAAERRRYGVPPEPQTNDGEARALWLKAVHSEPVTPPDELLEFPVRMAQSSANWSGRLTMSGANTYTSALMRYDEPSDRGTSCGNAAASLWAGLGGSFSDNLAQNGTVIGTNLGGLQQHQAWFEILPQNAVGINLSATPGGRFKAETRWLGNGNFQFSFFNEATGQSSVLTVGGGAAPWSGTSADFIAERPEVSGAITPLTNFGAFNVHGATANGQAANTWFNDSITMYNGQTPLAATSDWNSNSGFAVYWKNCA